MRPLVHRLLIASDVVLAAVLIAVAELEVATHALYGQIPVWPGPPAFAAVLVVALVAPIVIRRILPLPALVIASVLILVTVIAVGMPQSGVAVVLVLVVVYSGASQIRSMWPSLVAVVVLAATIITRPGSVNGVGDVVWFVGLFAISFGLGRAVAVWRGQVVVLREQQAELHRLHAVEVAAAGAAERAAIARELHDIVAHAVSVVVIQAQAGQRTVRSDPDTAAEALRTIETSGRGALVELRRLLTVLADGGPVGDGTAPLPTGGSLHELVERVRAAGLDLAVDCDELPELPPATGLAVHRTVQESLTNALKHAPDRSAALTIRRDRDKVRVEVRNSAATTASDIPGSARGLLGMRERLELVGGTLEAGTADGVFRVRAVVPLPVMP